MVLSVIIASMFFLWRFEKADEAYDELAYESTPVSLEEKDEYEYDETKFYKFALAFIAIVLLTVLLAPTKVYWLSYILAAIAWAFLSLLIVNVKKLTRKVPVFNRAGEKQKEKDGTEAKKEVTDKKLAGNLIFSIWCLGIPVALGVVYAKASSAKVANFEKIFSTGKVVIWMFVIYMIALGILAVLHYCFDLSTLIERLLKGGSSSEDEDVYSDSSLDPHSLVNWWKRNWLIVSIICLVVIVCVVCACMLHANGIL